MNWKNIKNFKPEPFTEVLVLVDGHRTSTWSNNYTLVAFIDSYGKWMEERHLDSKPIEGVIAWTELNIPVGIQEILERGSTSVSADTMVCLPAYEYHALIAKTYAEDKPERPYLYPSAE
jgi:hypothetical protein